MLPQTIRSKITAWTCNLCCNLWSFRAYSLFKVVWLGLYTLKPVWLRRKSSKIRFSGGINGFGHCDHKPYLTTLLKNEFGSSATLGSGYLVPLSRPKLPNPRRRAGPKLIFRWYGKWCMAQTKLIAPIGWHLRYLVWCGLCSGFSFWPKSRFPALWHDPRTNRSHFSSWVRL